MTVTLNSVLLTNGATVANISAPLIEGAAATDYSLVANVAHSFGFTNSAAFTGRRGARLTLPSVADASTHRFLGFALYAQQYGFETRLGLIAEGGIRVVFVDSSGRYAGYNAYGRDVPGLNADGPILEGMFGVFVSPIQAHAPFWYVDRHRTPDIASAQAIDWTQLAHVEFTVNNNNGSFATSLYITNFSKTSGITVTGNETLNTAATSAMANSLLRNILQRMAWYQQCTAVSPYLAPIPPQIGNGVAATNLTDSAFALGFINTYDQRASFRTVGPLVQLEAANYRPLRVVQSAADVLSLTDGSVASAAWWSWELSGSGVATCTRVAFWRFNGFLAAHGTYDDCFWDAGVAPVSVTTASKILGGVIRNGAGLEVTSGPGDYSALTPRFAGNTRDITVGAGGAGTYTLTGVQSSAPLKIHNASAVNAVTVVIPRGMAYSTTTAGGSITVTTPVLNVTISAPALIAGSRVQLYDVGAQSELLNTELPGVGLAHVVPYTVDKAIRLRADHNTKLPLEVAGMLTASGLTFLDVQEEDTVYLNNGIDGSTITEFIPDGQHIQIDINDPDGLSNVQRLYAWMQWYMTTEEGVRSFFFGAVNAIDDVNYEVDQTRCDLQLDNISGMPLRVVGGRLARKDGSTVIAPNSFSIQMDPGKAYSVETGVSGLTTAESARLLELGTPEGIAAAVRAALTAELARIDVPVSTRSTLTAQQIPAGLTAEQVWVHAQRTLTVTAGMTPEQEAKIDAVKQDTQAIKARTDLIPNDPARESTVETRATPVEAAQAVVETSLIGLKPPGSVGAALQEVAARVIGAT